MHRDVADQAGVYPREVRRAPLSFSQERFWLLEQITPSGGAYNVSIAMSIRGQLDVAALRRALSEIVRRHEILRTALAKDELNGAQIVFAPEIVSFPFLDFGSLGSEESDGKCRQLCNEETQRPFDLYTPPLFRSVLVRRSQDDHVLIITAHHAVCDGWSLGKILPSELSTLYRAFAEAVPSPLKPLSLQYADYALLERQRLHGQALDKRLRFWKEYLRGYSPLDLPADRARPAQRSFRGQTYSFQFPKGMLKQVEHLSRAEGATEFMVLLTAFDVVLSRWAGQSDVVVGCPVAGRNRRDVVHMFGMFANMLPIRLDVSGDPSFSELLRRLRENALRALAYQDLPLERIVAEVQRERDLSRQALFDVTFNWHVRDRQEFELPGPGLSVTPFEFDRTWAPFDMSWHVLEVDGELHGYVEYATDLFESSTIERFTRSFEQVLRSVTEDTALPISRLPILDELDRHRQLVEWNATARGNPTHRCIQELIEEQVERAPNALAVVSEGEELTYAQLNRRANQLAHYLHERGVKPDTRVGICVERGVELVVGLLGILKSGGAYVPLDPSYPSERLAYMLNDAAPALVLTQERLRKALPSTDAAIVALDAGWSRIAQHSEENLQSGASELTPRNLAYVIYTSGSTGDPKGVMVEHAGVVNLLCSMQASIEIGADDCMLAVTSVSFDIAALELYLPLINGAKVIIASREAASDAQLLSELLDRCGATVMQATPVTWRLLLSAGWGGQSNLKVLCGGEALAADLSAKLVNRVRALWNLYGPTETTIWSCSRKIEVVSDEIGAVETIGRPIANTRIYILDRYLEPVPVGVSGEIYIGGVGVARGYLNRPNLTAERFVSDPFTADGRSRLYKSGDLGCWRADGTIAFLGRNDDQVKIRGHRIEPEEIEARLLRHASVSQAVVLAREDQIGDKRLTAYVVPTTKENDELNLDFSLFYFGADTYSNNSKYDLYLRAARFADENGFEAIWTPERHFDDVGSLYPNPSVLSAALSTMTSRAHLRAGSVVVPLHSAVRIAEEWAVVDNLSNGRVGIAAASGWHSRDFVLAPSNYKDRRKALLDGIAVLRTLWEGNAVLLPDGTGRDCSIETFPKPLQKVLPLWISAAGNPATFALAGELGANVLTHLLGQTVNQLADKILIYRRALAEHGHDPEKGRVTLMVHTFVGQDYEATLTAAKEPFLQYLRKHLGLLETLVKTLDDSEQIDLAGNLEDIVGHAFERYSRTASLIGTPQTCLPLVQKLDEIGVDEIACLIDWMGCEDAYGSLPSLNVLKGISRKSRQCAVKLRRHLETQLPAYMIPSAFVLLDELPLLPNGKINRAALPRPNGDAPNLGYIAPRTPMEREIASAWATVLKVERVGVLDDFFALGGHSLLAAQLLTRMQAMLNIHIPLRALFEAPTVEALALKIEEIKQQKMDTAPKYAAGPTLAVEGQGFRIHLPPLTAKERPEVLPLSYAQEPLWTLEQITSIGPAYNVCLALHFDGQLDRDALALSFNELVRRQESLRTRFDVVANRPVQVIAASWESTLNVTDLSGLALDQRDIEARRFAREEFEKPFDLLRGPLFRASILHLEERENVVLIATHHIVTDGWSIGILLRELNALYKTFLFGAPSTLPELPVQYADYALWQRDHVKDEMLASQIDFWKDRLVDAPESLLLPMDKPRPAVASFAGAEVRFEISSSLVMALKTLSLREGASLYMVLMAAFQLLLGRWSGGKDIVVGSPISRRHPETEGIIGVFLMMLILRIDLTGRPSFRTLLERVKEAALLGYEHPLPRLQMLIDQLRPVRDLSKRPIYQVVFALQNTPSEAAFEFPGIKVTNWDVSGKVTALYDLGLALFETPLGLQGSLQYATDLFNEETMDRLVHGFKVLLGAIVADPTREIDELPIE